MTQAWSVRDARERTQTSRHRELLDAAARVFGELGYEGTTVAAITAEAGVSRATLYVYFASKDEIFHALAERVRDEFLAAQEFEATDPDPSAALRVTIHAYAAAVLAAGPLLRLIDQRGAVDSRVGALAAEINERPLRRFTRYLDRQAAAGAIAATASHRVVAETIGYALTHGMLARRGASPAARAVFLDDMVRVSRSLLGLPTGPGE
ncbi:helix-turn-helix domain-containing protein [Nocardia sp. NPDC048505]|uniref:TetR/AcrR family transcriptional regulator n=1 Tax=Nocardia sp. NPDC048505 TaxID=3155756 RepID=UPI0033EB990D